MNNVKVYSLNLLKNISLILVFYISLIFNAQSEKFVVTGHVYANINEFEYILQETKENKITTMFLLGDIKSKILEKIPYYEDKLKIKIYTVPGNHEFPNNEVGNNYLKNYGNYKSIVKGDVLHVLLNSMENNLGQKKFNHAGYGVEGKQLEFLKKTINITHKNIKKINIFLHHSLFLDKLDKKEIKKIIYNPENKLNSSYIKKQEFLSNDLTQNNWYKDVHPLLQKEVNKGKTINVFSGDNSLSLSFVKDEVNYFLTGLRQYYKPPLHKKNMQSYIICNYGENCVIKFFNNHSLIEKLDLLYYNKPTAIINFKNSDRIKLKKKLSSKYLFLEKTTGSNCHFPTYITLENKRIQEKFTGLKTSKNKMIFFTNNQKNKKYFHSVLREHDKGFLEDKESVFCKKLTLKIYNNDITKIRKYMKRFDTYEVQMPALEISKLSTRMISKKERENSKFRFKKAKGKIKFKDAQYNIRIKPRGGERYHWENEKKSYTIKAYKSSQPTKLFYIPEKRAISGEHLIQKIAKFMNLQSLHTSYGYLKINGKNNGLYYISEDFNKQFLIKNNLPESNIYHTDPYKTTSNYNISAINKKVFLGNIKKYKKRFDSDIDYFIKTINQDNVYLSNNWKNHFDSENLVKMLSLYLFSGTTHYNLHNMYFYINPVNGKIYFFPWDFMNYSHGDRLDIKDGVKYRDSVNFNQIFAKLLEIKEIRYLRNKYLYEQSENILGFIEDFENEELPHIFLAMLFDETIPLSVGEGGRKSFLEFMKISQRIKKNIMFNLQRLKENETELKINSIIRNGSVQLNSELLSYAGIKINCIKIIFSDNSKSLCHKKGLKLQSDIEYEKHHRANIKIKRAQNVINIPTQNNKMIRKITVDYSRNFSEKMDSIDTVLIRNKNKKTQQISISKNSLYPNILMQKSGRLYFKSNLVSLKNNLILPKGTTLHILPGTKVLLDKGISIISYGSIIAKGTIDKKIMFSPLSKLHPWGSIALVGQNSKSVFEFSVFDGGSGTNKKGGYFSAMLAAHYVDEITINNSIFKNASNNNGGDDSINVKYGKVTIKNTSFINNGGDGIDFDFVDENSSIINSSFIDNKNDAIDVSSSSIFIDNCNIHNSGDKGISAGEKSQINIKNCKIYNSKMGIASKDESFVKISNSRIYNNTIGIALYNKKEYFDRSTIRVINSKIENNYINCGEETYNKFGHDNSKIILDKKLEKTNKKYTYIINVNIKGMSKKDIISTFYENGNFNEYINYVTFKDCDVIR